MPENTLPVLLVIGPRANDLNFDTWVDIFATFHKEAKVPFEICSGVTYPPAADDEVQPIQVVLDRLLTDKRTISGIVVVDASFPEGSALGMLATIDVSRQESRIRGLLDQMTVSVPGDPVAESVLREHMARRADEAAAEIAEPYARLREAAGQIMMGFPPSDRCLELTRQLRGPDSPFRDVYTAAIGIFETRVDLYKATGIDRVFSNDDVFDVTIVKMAEEILVACGHMERKGRSATEHAANPPGGRFDFDRT